MLSKQNEIYNFWTLKLKENYFYVVSCRVTPVQNSFQALGGQKRLANLGLLQIPDFSF